MTFKDWTIEELKANGFGGFVTVAELQESRCIAIANRAGGVYVVVRPCMSLPVFLKESCGGWYKGRCPSVSVEVLCSRWLDSTPVLYVGKAGGTSSGSSLRARMWAYMRYGRGEDVSHEGGRYVWQLARSSDLVVCWRTTPGQIPRSVEAAMIVGFKQRFGKHPFANISA